MQESGVLRNLLTKSCLLHKVAGQGIEDTKQ